MVHSLFVARAGRGPSSPIVFYCMVWYFTCCVFHLVYESVQSLGLARYLLLPVLLLLVVLLLVLMGFQSPNLFCKIIVMFTTLLMSQLRVWGLWLVAYY
jgi:hypothetical protein